MSFFGSLNFYLLLAILSIPAIVLGISEKPKKLYGLIVSLLFIFFVFGSSKAQLASLVLYLFYEYILIFIISKLSEKDSFSPNIFKLAIIMAVLPLIAVKLSLPGPLRLFGFLGISYMTFRVLQIVVDIYDKTIQTITPFDCISFLLFFPTISSGPIDRSRRFLKDHETVLPREQYLDLLYKGLWKILFGLAYKFTFATFFFHKIQSVSSEKTFTSLIVYAYIYGFYLFFDFAGYSHLAVGVSYLFGVKMPDNFNFPFISRDIKEFWDRWHISLSHWLRDYFFSRFIYQAIKRQWFKSRISGATIGYILNMSIMGLWHGLSVNYILYGLFHGLLLAATDVYQKKSPFHKKNKGKIWYSVISWMITLHLVMFGFLIFSNRLFE